MKNKISLILARKILAVLSVVAYIAAVLFVVETGIVPVKYLVLVILLTAGILGLVTFAHFRRDVSRALAIVLTVASIFIIVASICVISVSSSTSSFFKAIQPAAYSEETYTIIARKARSMQLADAKRAAILSQDPYYEDAANGLKAKTLASPVEYGDATSLMVALEGDQTDVAVLNDGYMRVAKENYANFDQAIEVLATYTVRVKHETEEKNRSVSEPFVVYISGIDTYGSISSVSRSDVNMLAVVNPVTHKVLLVNTPRDYYVQLHGTTGSRDKLTHAGIYGIDMSRHTLEDLYGVKIDYYLRVNFTSLENIVNTLGGVDVYSDTAFKSYTVGYNHLNGAQALEFSRERYSFSEGDRQRGRNQQRVIEAIIAKMSDPNSAVNYQAILGSLSRAIQTNMTPQVLAQLANRQLDDMKGWKTESVSVDGTGSTAATYSMGSQPLYVMIPDQQTVDAARVKIQSHITY